MRKSFKKVIACLLAVLMVTFSVPFSALAASDDYKPNITMRFGTFVEDSEVTDNGGALTSTEWGVKKPSYDAFSGPNGAPLDYEGGVDKETGALKINRLYLENSKVKGVLAYNGVDESAYTGELTGQTDYVQGMPFTMTLTLNNVSTLAALDGHLKWSDNIAPALVWKSGTTNTNQTGKVGTFADYEADKKAKKTFISEETGTTAATARSVLTQYSCDTYYAGKGMNTESGYANASKGQIYTGVLADATVEKPSFAPLNTADIDNVTDPKTGETGYNCDNDAILITFLFIVTGEISEANPLEITIRNPNVSNDWATTETINELLESQQQTYAPRANCPGSTHLFFMGYNKHTKETIGATEHTHTAGEPTQENVVPATCTTDGSYDEVIKCTECGEVISTTHKILPATGHKFVDTVVAPTCTAQGYTLHKCSVCGEETKDTYKDALGHEYGDWVIDVEATETTEGSKHRDCVRGDDTQTAVIPKLTHVHTPAAAVQENVVPATCEAAGSYDEVVRCSKCGEVISTTHKILPATGHKFVDTVVAPTCTAQGYTLHKCSVCGEETKDTYKDALGHEYGDWVIDVEATETTEGSKHRDCVRGDDTQTAVIPKLTHVHTPAAAVQENVVPATCEAAGSYDEVVRCSKCGEVISTTHKTTPALGHKWKATKVVAPTYESQGYTEYVCENDPSHTKKDDYTAKLDGVKLTVNGKYSSYGSVEGYDFDKATWAGKNSTVTLKASPIEGAVFAGWEIDGKVVSTANTLELTMYKDITVTPIFQEEQKSTITVVFLDMYNNVTASYTNMTAAEFQAEMAKAIPTPAEYPGYTFAGWSQTDDAIKALDTSATITSSYKTRGNSYTVNAQGANITVNGETKADTFADIAYDTAVTVSADNAKAWAIDGTTVAVGSSYTFYVGSDVTITPVTDAVTDKPMTAIVSAAPATAGSYRVSFLASSYIPAGYTVIDRGFVYGKGATQDELTLEKVGTTIAATGAKVKSISVPTNKDTVNDFGLVYGVKNKDAAATAVAYVTVKSMADDSVTTVYSTISEFNY